MSKRTRHTQMHKEDEWFEDLEYLITSVFNILGTF